ncbi:MAG: DUF4349 domain-containing protein, partial [Ignavibacterium sp.]
MLISTKLFRTVLAGFMFLILIIVTSCNSGDNSKNVSTDFAQPEALTKNISAEQNNISSVERKIIKSGSIRFETQSVKET